MSAKIKDRSIAIEIHNLSEELLKHKKLYYAGSPAISDSDYDRLEDKLKQLDPKHPVLQTVGGSLNSQLPKVKHKKPMLSLGKTYVEKDLLNWAGHEEVVGTYKIDGNSLSLIYRSGELVQAKTRGDGKLGEDVLAKVSWVAECLRQIKTQALMDFEIRGELYCNEESFAHLAHEMQQLGLEKPTNPRNIVAGILGRKQHIELARYFGFFAFDVLHLDQDEDPFVSENEKMQWLQRVGFSVPPYKLIHDEQNLLAFLKQTKDFMQEGEIGIDGAVFTYNDCQKRLELGATAHHPRYKLSFKWQGETAQARIIEISWATSRLGIVTPVAVIEPTYLSGAQISNITLHNASYVVNYDLKADDLIEFVRSGEVIPKFLRVIEATQGKGQLPKKCPSCGDELHFDEVRLLCPNSQACPAQKSGQILNWIRSVGIDDLSEKRLFHLLETGMVSHPADLYKLKENDFLKLPLTKEKMAKKLADNISKTKTLSAAAFLCGLGIQGVGTTTWNELLRRFKNLEALQNAKIEEIIELKGFAETLARQIVGGLKEKRDDIEALLSAGVQLDYSEIDQQTAAQQGVFSGMIVVITGTLSRPRSDYEKIIVQAGGKLGSSVSKNTSALVLADPNSQSSKAKKARQLGVEIWSEEDLMNHANNPV